MSDFPRCDFCSAREVTWSYPARDFEHTTPQVRDTILTLMSGGDWAACDACHDLIERSERDALADRSARTHPSRGRLPLRIIRRVVRGTHDAFWANREGPPVRYPEGRD